MKYYPSLRMTDTNKYLSFEAFKSFQFGITEKMSKKKDSWYLKIKRTKEYASDIDLFVLPRARIHLL